MRRINSNIITEEVKRLCIEGNTILGDDVIKSFEEIDKLRAEIEQLNGIISRDVDKHECYVISKKHRS